MNARMFSLDTPGDLSKNEFGKEAPSAERRAVIKEYHIHFLREFQKH